MQRSINLVPPSQQRLHKQQVLQKLSHQKPYWDQARLSSLVNKQVAVQGPVEINLFQFKASDFPILLERLWPYLMTTALGNV